MERMGRRMDAVKGWAAALCAVAIGCTLLQMLAPKGGMGKIFRMITAAFFLCCLVSPLLNLKSLLKLDLESLPTEIQSEMPENRLNEQVERQISAAVQRLTETTLEGYGLSAEKIVTEMDTSEDGSIYIKRIILYLDKQNMAQSLTIRQLLEQRLGLEVDVAADG